MTIGEMIIALGNMLVDPAEKRFKSLEKLRRLNLAQYELVSKLPPGRVGVLPVETGTLTAAGTPITNVSVPTNFIQGISATGTNRLYRFAKVGESNQFPYGGSPAEVMLRIETAGTKLYFYGALHDEDVSIVYHRIPVEMEIDTLKKMDGVTTSNADVDCEMPEYYQVGGRAISLHQKIVEMAYNSFMLTDAESDAVKEGG